MATVNDEQTIDPNGRTFAIGWEKMKLNFLVFFLMVFLLSILSFPLEFGKNETINNLNGWGIIVQIILIGYWFFFLPVIDYSVDLIFLQGIRGEKPDVKNIIIGFNNYINIILANILRFGLVGVAIVMLIVPGIYVACRLAFVSYLVMDKNLSPIEAVEESWRMTKGYGWKIFGMGFAAIFIFIGGFIVFFVGIFPAIMWVKSYFAVCYQQILNRQTALLADENA